MTWLRRLFGWGDGRREADAPAACTAAAPPAAPIPVLTVGEAAGPPLPRLLAAAGFTDAEAWAAALIRPMRRRGILGPRRVAAFLATIAHESAGGRILEENLRYSAQRLTEIWPARFPTLDAARPYAWDPADPDREDLALANLVYGRRLGNEANGTADDDGWRYRGRGLIQLTGRANYGMAADALRLPLLADPDLAATQQGAAEIAAWFWSSRGCNDLADAGDVPGWRRRVNGGLIGLDDVRRRYEAVLAV